MRSSSAGPAGRAAVVLALASLASSACRSDSESVPTWRDAGPPRRVIGPATSVVRSLPPHAIREDGIGPYRLDELLGAALAGLASGPRLALFEFPGVVDVSLIRAEEDGLLVGAETVTHPVAFVAAVRAELARTDKSIGVGATRREADDAHGPLRFQRGVVRDPALVSYAALPNVWFVFDGTRLGGILVRRGEPAASNDPPCATKIDPVVAAGAIGMPITSSFALCTVGSELVLVGHEALAVVGGEPEKPRRLAMLQPRDLLFAGALPADDRHEVVVATERRSPETLAVSIAVYRWDGGRLLKVSEQEAYRLSATQAMWNGIQLADVELLLEVRARRDRLVVGGVLVHRVSGVVRTLVPVDEVTLARPGRAKDGPEPMNR